MLTTNLESFKEIFTCFYDRKSLLLVGSTCEINEVTKTLLCTGKVFVS